MSTLGMVGDDRPAPPRHELSSAQRWESDGHYGRPAPRARAQVVGWSWSFRWPAEDGWTPDGRRGGGHHPRTLEVVNAAEGIERLVRGGLAGSALGSRTGCLLWLGLSVCCAQLGPRWRCSGCSRLFTRAPAWEACEAACAGAAAATAAKAPETIRI